MTQKLATARQIVLILASRDAGDHWALLLNWLPPVYALEAAIIDR